MAELATPAIEVPNATARPCTGEASEPRIAAIIRAVSSLPLGVSSLRLGAAIRAATAWARDRASFSLYVLSPSLSV